MTTTSSITQSVPFAAVILAAGKSTRMRSQTPKALHRIAGKHILQHVIDAVQAAGAQRIVIVVGHQSAEVMEALGDEFEYVLQSEQLGTGHAVKMAKGVLFDTDLPIVVVPGDAPLVTGEALIALVAKHGTAAVTLLTVELDDPTGYGRIIRNHTDQIVGIVEQKDANDEQRKLKEVGVSIYAFQPQYLFGSLDSLSPENVQREYYLTDVVAMAYDGNAGLNAITWRNPEIGLGVNNRADLADVSAHMNRRIVRQHQINGVTIVDPSNTYIDAAVRIGEDTTVLPYSLLQGVTDIGKGCEIGPGARISDSQIGANVRIRDSHVVSSEVGDSSLIGPFANLRPGSTLGKGVKIGDFVEIKNSTLGDGVSAGHHAYLGDATVGENTNIGAGCITCNFDGTDKHHTYIGARAFVGSNSTLVAPLMIDDDVFIAAGSTITDAVPTGALALGRARQENKPGWVERRRRTLHEEPNTTAE